MAETNSLSPVLYLSTCVVSARVSHPFPIGGGDGARMPPPSPCGLQKWRSRSPSHHSGPASPLHGAGGGGGREGQPVSLSRSCEAATRPCSRAPSPHCDKCVAEPPSLSSCRERGVAQAAPPLRCGCHEGQIPPLCRTVERENNLLHPLPTVSDWTNPAAPQYAVSGLSASM